ncbi:uncharacterized protein LOC120893202 isoform X2 [Anopheles arabiensis]|uniref:uncharacterized protein LOC120893202 isoform X2 n=1 Tax=Anopheles arabiensis TaxID=7173 RepID=UPI001AACEC54|nr:uncharacterized protein LOC120893202 isoform X2 [Anopheles arabiensis]
MTRERQNAGKKTFSAEHNQLLVLKLVEHIDDPCSEQERWENIAEEIMFETGENYPWRTVRMHYKQRIVSHLKEYTDDQRMIDRLQYPFLDQVYKLRVQYQVSALVLQDPAIIARNKLIIKYEIDPRFDADVVKVFKRYHTSSMQICINVQDPAYELSERWQKFLLKPTKSRHRLKLTMCGDLWFLKFPAYMNRSVRKAPVAVTQQSSQESCSSSVILLDNVPVRIEECTSPAPPAPFSPRQLLSFESLDCDTLVLQMLDIHGNMNDSPESVQGNGNVDKPIDANVPPPSTHPSDSSVSTSEEPQETFYPMPDCVFDSTDSEDEDEDMRNESRQPVANGNVDKSVAIDSNPPPLTHPSDGDVSSSEDLQESFCPMPDCVFDSTDSEDEDEDMRTESHEPVANGNVDELVPIDVNVPPPSTHPSDGNVSPSKEQPDSSHRISDCVLDSTNIESAEEEQQEETLPKPRSSTASSIESDTNSVRTVIFNGTAASPNTEHHSSGNDDRQTEPALPAAPLPYRIDITTLFQYEAALGPLLKRKKNVYDSIRSWMPLLFIKPTDSYVPAVSLFAKLALLQRIATDMNLILNPTVRVEDLMPVILRILCGARESQ